MIRSKNDEISEHMVAVVNDLALRFALVDDDEVVAYIKKRRIGLVDQYVRRLERRSEARPTRWCASCCGAS